MVSFSWDTTGRLIGKGCDWDSSPPGCHQAYDRALLAWGDGQDVHASDFQDEHLSWLLDPGLRAGWDELARPVSFVRLDGDKIIFLDEAVVTCHEYPGWAARAGDPRLGKRHGTQTRELVLDLIRAGTAVTRMAITRGLNHMISTGARPDLAGFRGLTLANVKKTLQRLRDDGLIFKLEEPLRYWKDRHWCSTAAVWNVDPAHPDNQAADQVHPDNQSPTPSPQPPEISPAPSLQPSPRPRAPAAPGPEAGGSPAGTKRQLAGTWGRRQVKKLTRAKRKKAARAGPPR